MTFALRVDDLVDDGRVRLEALPSALGSVLWPQVLRDPAWRGLAQDGIVPVLTRLTLSGGSGQVGGAVDAVQVAGSWRLARVEDDDGDVERIVALLACDLRHQGLVVGEVAAEYTLARPSAPRNERTVTSLPGEVVPDVRHVSDAAAALMALPRHAEPLEPVSADPAAVVFGLDDTDRTRQVSPVAVLRRFREAGLRRLRALGVTEPLRLRRAELAYRRPCALGEVGAVELRAFRGPEGLAVACALGPDDPAGRSICYARLSFGS